MLTLWSPMLALEMLSPIAVTETTEVGTGWERGGNGVTPGSPQAGAAAGGASLYNLRLPPKASGKDTGDPSAPGFKGYRPCRRPQQCGGSQLCVSECRQRIRNSQTPPKSELRHAKNGAFATLPHAAERAP